MRPTGTQRPVDGDDDGGVEHPPDLIRDGLSRFISDRRRLAWSIVFGLLLATGVVLLLGKASGFAKLAARLREAHPGWLMAGVAVQVLSIFGYVIGFRAMIAREGRGLGLVTTGHIVMASLGATRLLAAAGAGGLAVNYWALRRLGIAPREAVIRVLMLNTVLYAVFGLAAAVAAAVLLGAGDVPVLLAVIWIAVVVTAFVAARFVSQPVRAERLAREPAADGSGSRLRLTVHKAFATAVAGVVRVRPVIARPMRHLGLVGGAMLYWAGDIACLAFGLKAFDVSASVGVIVLGYATGYVANVLPLPTGGVGGVDAAMTFALHLLGLTLDEALAGVIAYRFIGFWLPTIPAAWALIALPRLGRKLAAPAG